MSVKRKILIMMVMLFAALLLCLSNKCYASSYEYSSWGYDEGKKTHYDILSDGTASVTSYDDDDVVTLNVPSTVNGRKVTHIGKFYFTSSVRLKKVVLPNTIKEIEYGAFYNNIALEEINIPSSVTKIGEAAFSGDRSLKSVDLRNVKIISDSAFQECSALTQINLNNVESVGEDAFYKCESLKNAKLLSSKLTAIGEYAFYNCSSLEKIYLSNSINVFGNYVFYNDNNLKIYGFKGSKSEQYAKNNSITFITIVFVDVFEDDWFYNAAMFNYNNNFIKGTDSTHFAPNDKVTRGMIVTILWRMEGSPNNDGKSRFSDVNSSMWYAKATKWAVDKGIVHGYDGTTKFGPDDNIIRQDLAGILRNYAKYKGKNVNVTADLTKFSDYKQIDNYAKASMQWAVGKGVITGNANGTVAPKGNATRAEAAAMIEKYSIRVGR